MSSSLAQREEDRPRASETGILGAVLAPGNTLAMTVHRDSPFHCGCGEGASGGALRKAVTCKGLSLVRQLWLDTLIPASVAAMAMLV